jgi:trigger factor
MKIKLEKQKNSRVKLEIVLEPEELVRYYRQAYEKIAAGVEISGFRPGKAPYKIIAAKVGHNKLLNDGLDLAVRESYQSTVAEQKISPLSYPEIVIKKAPNFSLDAEEIKDNLEYELSVDVMPEIKLKDYSKLKIKKSKKEEVKVDDVKKIIEHLRRQRATFKEADRGARKGDRVEINFSGKIKNVIRDKLCSKNFPLILGEGSLIPGFEDKLMDHKKGDKINFKIKFPKDYFDKEFAEQIVDFEVELLDVKEVILLEVDKTFAESFGRKSKDDLEKSIHESLEKEMEQNYQNKLEQEVVEKILPNLEVEIPKVLIDNESDRLVNDIKTRVESQGLKFEKYLENMKKDEETLRADLLGQAKKNIRIGFLLGKIIEEKKWDGSDKDASKKAVDYLVNELTK